MNILNIFPYLFVNFIFFKKTLQSHIIYPFKKSTKEKKEFPEDILQNDLEITLEIGTPPQTIDLNLISQESVFFVTSSELNLSFNTYNKTNSKSFKNLTNYITTFIGKEYKEGIKITESITINNKENKNISLIMAISVSCNESGALGLKLLDSPENGIDNCFIYQIKKKSNFDKYSFFIKYDENNDEKGELIIGSYPHIYDSKNFKEEEFFYHKVGKINKAINWIYDFDIIKYDNIEINNIITNCIIRIEFCLIQAPFKLKKFFNDTFFLGKCNETYNSKREIFIINCDKSLDIKGFKNLSFILKDIEYEFILTYKELFIEKDNEYIFGIVFDNYIKNEEDSSWIFGKTFMKKYQLYFDLDRKIIGLYKNNNKRKDEEIKIFNINNIYLLIIIILIIIVIILIGFIIYLYMNQRKRMAFELNDDNYDYVPS